MRIQRVKLNYQPVAKRKSNAIAFVVSKSHLSAVNTSIRHKLERNKEERVQSFQSASSYHVGSNSSDVCSTKSFVKMKKSSLN